MPIYSNMPEGFYPRPSDVDAPLRSPIGRGPRGPQGHSITAEIIDTDPYGYFRVQFKDAVTGEVLVTTPNLDVGSRFYVCDKEFEAAAGDELTAYVTEFTTLQATADRSSVRVGDLVFFSNVTSTPEFLSLNTFGIGIVNSVTSNIVHFVVHDVVTAQLRDGAITTNMLANLCVTTEKIANEAIVTAKIEDGAVTTDKINNGAVTNTKMAQNSVGTINIIDAAVNTDKIADYAVTTGKITNLAVTTGKLDDSSVTSAKVANNAIINDKIAANKIEACFITANIAGFVYDPDTYVLTIPPGAIWHHGRGYGFNGVELDGSSYQSSGCFVIYVRPDNTLYAYSWNSPAQSEEDLLIGYAYRGNVWLYGVDPLITTDKIVDSAITTQKIANSAITTQKLVDGSVTNDKLDHNGIIRWNMAMFITSHQNKYIYNSSTYTLTLPPGAIWIRGRGRNYSGQTIDASSVQQSQAFTLFVNSSDQVYAGTWTQYSTNSGDPLIGYAYRGFVWLNGVDASLIEVVNNSGLDLNKTHVSSVGMFSSKYYVIYDYSAKSLTIPQGFATYRDKIIQINSQTLNLSSSLVNESCIICVNSNGVVSAVPYTNGTEISAQTAIIGKVQARSVTLFGLNPSCVAITNTRPTTLSETFGNISHRMAYLGLRDDVKVVYDQQTKTLTIPSGFNYVNGHGEVRQETILDLSTSMSSNCCIIVLNSDDSTISAISWNGCYSLDPRLYVLGYVYRNVVYLNGVPQSKIMVNGYSTSKFVYCFGDSITAGVGGSHLYHMYWHEWLQSVRFKNYGVGSTGYTVEHIGTAESGLGNEGDGTSHEWEGDNTIIQMMQSVSDSMWAISIAAGTNDWSRNTPAATFRTAVAAAFDYAQSITPRVLAITPIRRQRGTEPTTNTEGLTVEDYGDIIIEEAVARGIAYANGYDVAINPANEVSKTAYVPDGLHPNEDGQKRMARSYFNKLLEVVGE